MTDDRKLEQFVRDSAFGVWHACGTCKMGRKEDASAVTDSTGRVHGIAGLRVVDASLFPSIPSANINLTVIMTAEKIADSMLEATIERPSFNDASGFPGSHAARAAAESVHAK